MFYMNTFWILRKRTTKCFWSRDSIESEPCLIFGASCGVSGDFASIVTCVAHCIVVDCRGRKTKKGAVVLGGMLGPQLCSLTNFLLFRFVLLGQLQVLFSDESKLGRRGE